VKRNFLIEDRMAERAGGRRSPKSIAISVAIHAVLIALLATVTFHYEVTQVARHATLIPERVTYISPPPPAPAIGNGSEAKPAPPPKGPIPPPAPLVAPMGVPTGLPPLEHNPASAGAISGVPGGTGGRTAGIATGVEPTLPDKRVPLTAPPLSKVPRSMNRAIDSAFHAAYTQYVDSIRNALAHPKRQPGDWTTDVGGQKVGWDPQGIHLGPLVIPNAVLAIIKANIPLTGEGMNAVNDRERQAWITQDLQAHQQGVQGMDDEDFKALQQRIRANSDQQRLQDQQRSIGHGRDTTKTCCTR